MSEEVVTLSPSDVAAAMRLSTAANWNQTEGDWRRVLELEPEGCLGLVCDGTLVSTTTVVCYGDALAWIGMVLTDPACRGRGFARRLMKHALEFCERRRVAWIKLDATDMGRPLYLKLGFEDECFIERWRGTGIPACVSVESFHLDPNLDQEAFGADRTSLLHSLAQAEAASLPDAYAMGRPGRNAAFFGPCVSRTPEAARVLLQWFLSHDAGKLVYWDLLPSNQQACDLARELGFERQRRLARMVRRGVQGAPPLTHNDSYVYAAAGFEYG